MAVLSRKGVAAFAALAVCVGVAGQGDAGQAGAGGLAPSCSRSADGSGRCTGSFEAFRRTPAAGDTVELDTWTASSSSTYAFAATIAGRYYACTGRDPGAAWQAMASPGAVFTVTWDASGACTSVASPPASADRTEPPASDAGDHDAAFVEAERTLHAAIARGVLRHDDVLAIGAALRTASADDAFAIRRHIAAAVDGGRLVPEDAHHLFP